MRALLCLSKVMAPCKPNDEGAPAALCYGLGSPARSTPNLKEVATVPKAVSQDGGLVATGGDPT